MIIVMRNNAVVLKCFYLRFIPKNSFIENDEAICLVKIPGNHILPNEEYSR